MIKFLVNSSANFSGGAKNAYSEAFIFHTIEDENEKSEVSSVIKDFRHEFSVLWNRCS